MAHARLVAFLAVLAPYAIACSDPAQKRAEGPLDLIVKPTKPPAFTADDAAKWGKFHSKRFNVTLPLPDGKAWKIDDHHSAEMIAQHEPTLSRVVVRREIEENLMNRQRCEERARAVGIVPVDTKAFTTVEDEAWVGPEAFDSRVWVAIEAGRHGGSVTGHVFLFGSYIRTCLFVHLETTVPTAKDEEILATRLAVAEERIVKAISLDAPRTTTDAEVPKEKPDIRR